MKKKETARRGSNSLGSLLRNLRARAHRIKLVKRIVPEDIADDPRAILEWIRRQDRRERRRKKWE